MKANSTLVTKVKAENLNNKYLNELAPIIIAWLTPFIGQKFETQTGLVKKLRDTKPEFERPGFHWSLGFQYNNALYLHTRVCLNVPGESHCVYSKGGDYRLGARKLSILESLEVYTPRDEDKYSAEKIVAAKEKAEQLRSQAYDLEHDAGCYLFQNT